jgi:hypothetical protein
MPCRRLTAHRSYEDIVNILDAAGNERFAIKTGQFEAAIARTSAGQALYEGIMGALGYAKNKLPMITLAGHVPLMVLESGISGSLSGIECLARQQALLLGTAGLLPSQSSLGYLTGRPIDAWSERMEITWAASRRTAAMTKEDWHTFKVRPNNFPSRRIAAMSYLLLRYRKTGLMEGLINSLVEYPSISDGTALCRALLVVADSYWGDHLDLQKPSRNFIPTLLGNGRAADIVVNVLLPFTCALARLTNRRELGLKALETFSRSPKLAVNSVERHMLKQFGVGRKLAGTARRQQGLLHIYKTLCSGGSCHRYPAGQGR